MDEHKLFQKYLKLQPYYERWTDRYDIRLVRKPSFYEIGCVGYLFSPEDEELEKEKFDDIDKKIDGKTLNEIVEENKTGEYAILRFTGLHTCGGYHAFFRPDLREVCNIIPEYVFEKSKKIFITTNFAKNVPLFDEDIGITTAICVL